MKRLLGLTGITCLCALTACFYFEESVVFIAGIVSLVLFVVSMLVPSVRKEGTLPLAFATIAVCVMLFMGYTHLYVQPLQQTYEGKTCQVTAVQKKEVYMQGKYYCYELDVSTIGGEQVNTGLLLYSREHIFSEPYDEVCFEGELTQCVYSGEMSKRLFLRCHLPDEDAVVEVTTPDKKPLMYHIIRLRSYLRTSLYMELPYDTASFASAVLLGDKHAISDEVTDLLRLCGLSHISVVSGLHLSIIAAVFKKIFRAMFRNKYVYTFLTVLAILSFALLTGFGIPVIRSAVMLIIFNIGNLVSRRSDSLNSIGAAALLILLPNPYAVGDIGMLLSFFATIGIVVWSDKLSAPVKLRVDNLWIMQFSVVRFVTDTIVYSVVCSVCATVWTLPISIIFFGGFSLVSVVANLLTVPFLTIVIICAALCALLHHIEFLPLLSDIFGFVVNLYYEYLIFICSSLSKLPFAYINTDKIYFYIWLAVTLFLIAVALLIDSKAGYRITVAFSLLILLWSAFAYNLSRESVITLHIPDTGTALSVVAESTDGYAVLSCGGSKWSGYVLEEVIQDLSSQGRNVLVSTSEENSFLYAENLMNEFDYERVLLYDNNSTYTSAEVSTYTSEQTLYLWDKLKVELMPADGVVYEYITAGDTDILILPDGADAISIQQEYRTPDIIITHRFVDNIGLLSCDTLIIPGDDYMSLATAEISAPIANKIITGMDIVYDIKIN
ncbi:MAG: ComEC/Rec2 family competence protein [Ruminococcus sp.]|nr:ComEC/Rec2 family competence protein [Ruminococcus sp.]